MRSIFSLFIAAGLAFGSVAEAARSHHEQIDVQPIKKGRKVVGATISMILSNDDSYGQSKVSLVKTERTGQIQREDTFKKAGTMVQSGVVNVKGKSTEELILKVIYGKGNKLKGGEGLDVVSGWRNAASDSPHVWGAVLGSSRPSGHVGDITLPGGAAKRAVKAKAAKASR